MTRFDPVVVDLDGTLIDSMPAIDAGLRYACENVGEPLAPGRDLTLALGPPLVKTLAILLSDQSKVPAGVDAFRWHYETYGIPSTKAFPGAAESLDRIKEAGITLAVATYKRTQLADKVLAMVDLARCFDVVVGFQDDDPKTKTDLIREALRRVEPHRVTPVYIGDHDNDERASAEAGIDFVRYGPRDWHQIASHVLGD